MGNQKQNVEIIKLPVGRLVWGSLYDFVTEDFYGKTLENPKYAFGIAIPKQLEGHWNQTEWGRKIWEIAHKAFPNGQTQFPNFAWKITDGDSQTPKPNKYNEMVKPCDKEGYPGNWVLNVSNQFAFTLYDVSDTKSIKILTQPGFINCGDFIEVAITCLGNNGKQTNSQGAIPGIYLNPQAVAFRAYGERILSAFKVDVNTIGFGQSPLPCGAFLTPPNSNMSISPTSASQPLPGQVVEPHYGILQTPPPPGQNIQKIMTSKASHSYEQYIAGGWTDQQLIQHGYMQA